MIARAAADGCTTEVSTILHRPQDPNCLSHDGMSPLGMAACCGHIEVAQLLLEAEAWINEIDHDGNTPLTCAAYRGHNDMVHLLLQAGSPTNTTNIHGDTALSRASARGYTDLSNVHGETALIRAAKRGHLQVVRSLLAAGADREVAMQASKPPKLPKAGPSWHSSG
ncbi:Ankrd17 [Symbiodinium natans]|uniref:Ankrd17 protein n=1 Tax=Symbiodinium natans TaxID=878477 RepID=A0A812FWC5_9DINO|nr:Ankrd17 [Symbiodinium natans]